MDLWETHKNLVYWWAQELAKRMGVTQGDLIGIVWIRFNICAKKWTPAKGDFAVYFAYRLDSLAKSKLRWDSERYYRSTESSGQHRDRGYECKLSDHEPYYEMDHFEEYLDGLDPRAQEIMRLRFQHGFTFEEISRRMGITKQWVHQLYTNAMEELRHDLHSNGRLESD